jgi:hypothetical protein
MSMMFKEVPDYHDAEMVVKLYDLRREAVLRESRAAINNFWPTGADEVVALARPDHPLNSALRQVHGYWEMVYGLAHHGIVHAEYLVENSSEGIFSFARLEPHVDALRAAAPYLSYQHTEWVIRETEVGRASIERNRALVQRVLEARRA